MKVQQSVIMSDFKEFWLNRNHFLSVYMTGKLMEIRNTLNTKVRIWMPYMAGIG